MCEQRRVPHTRDFYRHVDTHLPNNLRRVRCAYENCQHTSSERENMDSHIRNVHTKAEYRCEMVLPLPDENTQDAAHVIPGRIYVCGFASTDAGAWSKHEKAHKQSGEDVKKKVQGNIDAETVWVVPSSQSCKVRCWNASRKWVPPPPPLVEYMAPQVHEVEPNDVTFPEGRFPNGLKHLEPFIPRPQRDLPRRCSSPPVTRSAPPVIQRSSRRVQVKAEPVNSDELYTESDENLNRECPSIERVSSPMSPPPAKETSTNAPARDLLCNRLLFSLSPAIFPTPTPSASPPPRSHRLRIRTPYLRPCSPSFGEGLE
ncbi:hypothetical protein PHLGIDRAFT_146731 [Phlebiopsis gigantea 11061_1 CR5-6]|uniref:C2H2-type domain-containing protein n=1 Tax=Phlebiopsis gigantea (strain 11061_1 CR5-6) TaxID=745531 RepID=A0A0C3S5F9_PHLG1|nr:hypothetical protein PHLGIDRAFT_146731 [Phlebiopsis gigantea 11061_1 CR5-6]